MVERLGDRQAVLLGEAHESAEDHRWQLHTLAQLHAKRPQLALALEMFPRRLQPVLDRWVAGELTESEFLRQAEWEKVWGFDARDYLPLFHFARMNRLPMLAMNVDRALVDAVAREGWEAVPEKRREGISRPARPSAEYLKYLRRVFEHHPEKTRGEKGFATFTEAQTVWDRGMAQTIAEHLQKNPDSLVVGILGAGHVRHGYGVAHQLRDLGIGRVAGLVTWNQAEACSGIADGLADAVRIVAEPAANPPRLGISMEDQKDGVRVVSVVAGSVAEQAGIKPDDVIVGAAGQPVRDMQALRYAVQRQPPGTWLPLQLKRGGDEQEVVARFPADGK
ncbi:MAG: ChaN family lipoprotein [Rhodocyclales bacterium]|nr:ChaN family lipoprotein [Rhodocyclales bacterium]